MQRAVVGIGHNSGVEVEKLLVYVHEIVTNYAFLDTNPKRQGNSTSGNRHDRGTDIWLAGEGGLTEHALTRERSEKDTQKLIARRKSRGLLANDEEKTFLVAPEPRLNGGTSISDRINDERSNRGSTGNSSGYSFDVSAEDEDDLGDGTADDIAKVQRIYLNIAYDFLKL